MDDFVLGADTPNVFGLTGGDANLPAPGKRPQSSMSPTILLHDGRPRLVLGGSGGPFIVSGTLQVLLGMTAFGLDAPAAVEAPRIHDQGTPAVLVAEAGLDPAVRAALERIGHHVTTAQSIGAVAVAGRRPDGTFAAAGDPRKDTGAETVP
jgi:gamma-glutamyltranspeptidase/glutathione hydrolase